MSFRGWLWTGSGMNPGPFDGPTATRETSCRLSTRTPRVDNLVRLYPVDLECGQLMRFCLSSFLVRAMASPAHTPGLVGTTASHS